MFSYGSHKEINDRQKSWNSFGARYSFPLGTAGVSMNSRPFNRVNTRVEHSSGSTLINFLFFGLI